MQRLEDITLPVMALYHSTSALVMLMAITGRAPKRAVNMPTSGLARAMTMVRGLPATINSARDQPNSASIAGERGLAR